MLTLAVIAKDEADRIGDCLDSVPCATERLVLDSGSTDGTPDIATDHGARVVVTDWPGHVAQKNRALSMASNPWVISLDADERLSPEAVSEVERVLQNPGRSSGYSFPRCSRWLGTPLRNGRWYPDRKVRLVRRERATWVGDDPHDHLEVKGPVTRLRGDIIHFPYRDLSEHLSTIDRYSRISADSLSQRGVQAHWWDVVGRPPLHFVDAYLLRTGFRDGVPGFAVATLGATHVMCKWYRLWKKDLP